MVVTDSAPDEAWAEISEGVLEARASRLRSLAGSEALVSEVSAILFARDPIELNFETNTDEYDAEARTIVIRLPDARSLEDLARICREEFARWFDAGLAGPTSRYGDIAAGIWAAATRPAG